MQQLIKNPHYIFWSSIPLMLFYGVLNSGKMLNINILAYYFVFSLTDLTYLISLLFLIAGVTYWLMLKNNKNLSRWLNLSHIFLTFGSMLIILTLTQLYREPGIGHNFNQRLTMAIYIIVLAAFAGQVLFGINLMRGLFRSSKNSVENH